MRQIFYEIPAVVGAVFAALLAKGHYDDGQYVTALKLYRDARAVFENEKVLGKEHPDTASSYNGLANVYYYKGLYDTALKWYGKALLINEKVLGLEHPNTALVHFGMANVYYYKKVNMTQRWSCTRNRIVFFTIMAILSQKLCWKP